MASRTRCDVSARVAGLVGGTLQPDTFYWDEQQTQFFDIDLPHNITLPHMIQLAEYIIAVESDEVMLVHIDFDLNLPGP